MLICKQLSVFLLCLLSVQFANAGRPSNGTTLFNSVSAGAKASGNAGTGLGITATNIEGFNFNLTTGVSGPVMVIEIWDGSVSSGNGVAFYEQTSSINPLFSGLNITSNDGAIFDLLSIGINAQSSGGGNSTVTITGLNSAGNPVGGATTTGVASVSALTTFNVSANAAFKGIAGIRITSSDVVYAFIDNINLANVGTVLPLSWLDFSATSSNNKVVLNWSTAMEQQTKYFVIQQSINGADWNNIGTSASSGNSSNIKFYSYVHSSPNNGGNYYRLIEQDINGRQHFSNVIYINMQDKAASLSIYPTLSLNGYINVKINENTKVQIFDNAGSLLMVKQLQKGVNQLIIDKLPAGFYRLNAGVETSSFLVQ